MEHDRTAGQRGGGDDGGASQPAGLDVRGQLIEIDPLAQCPPQRRGIKQRLDPQARDAEHLAGVALEPPQRRDRHERPGDLAPAHRRPRRERLGDQLIEREMCIGGQEAHIHRTGAGSDQDPRPLAALLQHGQQHRQRARLVGAAGATAREHDRNALLTGGLAHTLEPTVSRPRCAVPRGPNRTAPRRTALGHSRSTTRALTDPSSGGSALVHHIQKRPSSAAERDAPFAAREPSHRSGEAAALDAIHQSR